MAPLLFDEQLSERLVNVLGDVFPGSLHVRHAGAGGASDALVWQRARELGCTVVTKDEDFQRLAILRGAPPKVVWIRLGNCSTEEVAELLRQRRRDIEAFEAGASSVLELG
jgi:predicted nuclease of predicted toxin-antitoxin system